MQSPFEVQELVDYILRFLRDSKPDLKTCALVCRSWAYLAQSHLFQKISVVINDVRSAAPENLWPRILGGSPHLNRYIRQLYLFVLSNGSRSICTAVWELCNFPFTHVDRVQAVCIGANSTTSAMALQQLFSLPTIAHIELLTTAVEPDHFFGTFQRCSPAMKHLDLWFSRAPLPVLSTPHNPQLITLETLSVQAFANLTLDRWLLSLLHPFTLSTVRALLIIAGPIVWPDLAPAMNNIGTLSIDGMSHHINLDLTAFPDLYLLRIRVALAATTNLLTGRHMSLLSAIARAPRLRTVILELTLRLDRDPGLQQLLDHSRIFADSSSKSNILHTAETYQLAAHFPQLKAKEMLRSVPYNPKWWEMLEPLFVLFYSLEFKI
ncbi:hypothetical protein DFH06DRAFT_1296232 [Mycena polygramma]|nr:hypothetical protein DFH06DRAFT_1296232 [Mycena polygramma]